VASVVDLAHAFGLTTVAEGVETAAQLRVLKELGCEQAQGYYWCPAVAADEAVTWICAEAARHPQAADAPLQAGATRVLVVEDEDGVRALLTELLDGEPGFAVVGAARDGREAIALARHHQPDIVLLDLAMPGIGGLEALPLLRAVSPGAKVVVLSGLDPADVEQRTRAEGAAGYLVKGSDLSNLPRFLDAIALQG
jgi:CheY-like chemotaxis protein